MFDTENAEKLACGWQHSSGRASNTAIYNSEMSHPSCVHINNRCRYQSITQQYLKKCLIKDDNNYMFRPIPAIIRFSSESMVVVLYRIGMGMSLPCKVFTNPIKHHHHTFG